MFYSHAIELVVCKRDRSGTMEFPDTQSLFVAAYDQWSGIGTSSIRRSPVASSNISIMRIHRLFIVWNVVTIVEVFIKYLHA